MNYWIFIFTKQKLGTETYSAEEIYSQRMQDKFWGLGEKTPNRKNLKLGDKVVYYMGLPDKAFAGEATLASDSFQLSDIQKQEYGHGKELYTSEFGVLLTEIYSWSKPKQVEDLVLHLGFIENKEYWFSYFQGGVRQITEEDYLTIVGKREIDLIESISVTKDLESQAEFALESHLEEFIYQNWESIDWGENLILYRVEDQDGRQFPAGTWSIDFLAVDTNNDFVVIELKRGKTSDATVGQVLRYINWVKANLAEKDQEVRGIIIAKEVDQSLKYSVMSLEFVDVKLYEVDFRLHSYQKIIAMPK